MAAVLVVAENDYKLTEHMLQKSHRGSLEVTLHFVDRIHIQSQTLGLLNAGYLETALVQQRCAALVKQRFQLLTLESSKQIDMIENSVFHSEKLENAMVILPPQDLGWVNNSKNHPTALWKSKASKAFDHEVKAVDLVFL